MGQILSITDAFESTEEWFANTSSEYSSWDIEIEDINHDGFPDVVQKYIGIEGHKLITHRIQGVR